MLFIFSFFYVLTGASLSVHGSVFGSGSYMDLSDRRFQREISPLGPGSLDSVLLLQGVRTSFFVFNFIVFCIVLFTLLLVTLIFIFDLLFFFVLFKLVIFKLNWTKRIFKIENVFDLFYYCKCMSYYKCSKLFWITNYK